MRRDFKGAGARSRPRRRPARAVRVIGLHVLGTVAAVLLVASTAHAQQRSLSTWGVRVGVSDDPDQLIVGMWGTVTEFSPNVSFRPGGDLGVGSDAVSLMGDLDVQYTFHNVTRGPVPFVGGGVGLFWIDPDGRSSDTEIGIQLYGGVELAYRGYQSGVFELRLGFESRMPDLKLTYGFGFY